MRETNKKPKLFYHLSTQRGAYRSSAELYIDQLESCTQLVKDPQDAQLIIIHPAPTFDAIAFYRENPIYRKKYLIGYCVWEASFFPRGYKRSLKFLDEIWTASDYCRTLFDKAHPNVHIIPHITVEPSHFSKADLTSVKRAIEYNARLSYFLCVTRISDPRKNINQLIDAFTMFQKHRPDTRLLIKCLESKEYVEKVRPKKESGVQFLSGKWSRKRLNALYSISSAVVSAHHSEGWGLTLADAMALGKLVVGTGYSGNMSFMNRKNSFLIDYDLKKIAPEDQVPGYFYSPMKWAYPKTRSIVRMLEKAYIASKTNNLICRQAKVDMARFNGPAVGEKIAERIKLITDKMEF